MEDSWIMEGAKGHEEEGGRVKKGERGIGEED